MEGLLILLVSLLLSPLPLPVQAAGRDKEESTTVFHPCYRSNNRDYRLYCEELPREDGLYDYLPQGMRPMQVGKKGLNRPSFNNPDVEFSHKTCNYLRLDFREYGTPLDSLSLVFSPVGEAAGDQYLYKVTVLYISIVNYEVLSGDFFARNCPYLRELYVAIDYLTDEQEKQIKGKGVTVLEGAFKNLKYLEVLNFGIRPPCVKIENFLLPFAALGKGYNHSPGVMFDAKTRLRYIFLHVFGNRCDLSSVKLANVNSLEALYLISVSLSAYPEYVPPGFSGASEDEGEDMHLFPRGLQELVIEVPNYLEMMCNLYQKIGRSNVSRQSNSIATRKYISIAQPVTISTLYALPVECTGMFDYFVFSNAHDSNNNTNHPTLSESGGYLYIGGQGLILNNAVWDGLVSRNWERVSIWGILSSDNPTYSFPSTATEIDLNIYGLDLRILPHSYTILLSSLCLFHYCTRVTIDGLLRGSKVAVHVRFSESVESETEHADQLRNYSGTITKELTDVTFANVNVAKEIADAIHYHYFPKLHSIVWENANIDLSEVFKSEYDHSTPEVVPQHAGGIAGGHYPELNICAEISSKKEEKPELRRLSVVEFDDGAWQGVSKSSNFTISATSFCKYSNIDSLTVYSSSLLGIIPGSFANVPLKFLSIYPSWMYRMPTNAYIYHPGRQVVVSGGLFGHEESLGASILISYVPIHNVTEELCAKSREQDMYFSDVRFQNVSLADFSFRSLCSPICNETDGALGYCNGVSNVDLSFNNLTSIALNWAYVYKIPSVLQEMDHGKLEAYTLKATNNQLKSVKVKNDLLPLQSSKENALKKNHIEFVKRNLSLLYATYDNNIEKFESNYEKPMASRMQLKLDFSNNNLQTLRAHSFSDMRSILKLVLRNNSMDAIEPGFVSGKSCFSHGCFIDLSDNRLGIRWSQTIGNLTRHVQEFKTPIRGFFLRNNMLDNFPYGISAFFAYYRKIWNNASLSDPYATVDLSHNNISSIDRSLCSGLSHVRGPFVLYVNLANNKLKYVSDDAFYCPANVQLLVNLNNNIDLIRLPEKAQLLRSLHLLSIVNTGISSKTLPCVYQSGVDVDLTLQSLAFAPSSWFSSATTLPRDKMMDCCTLYRLRRNYLKMQSINPELMENEGAGGLLKRLRERNDYMFANSDMHGKSIKCTFLRNHEQEGDSDSVMDFYSFDDYSCGICRDEDTILIVSAKWYSALLSWVVLGLLYILFSIVLCAYLFFTKAKIWEMEYATEYFSYSMYVVKNQLPSSDAMGELKARGEKRPNILSYFTLYEGTANVLSDYLLNPVENQCPNLHYNYAVVADALPDVDWKLYYSSPLGSEYILVYEGEMRK
eukprot:Nk52_evm12s274 gene=Nk52_evmTU12s274